MSNSVDNRIVELDFNTSKFEKGVRKVLDGVAELKSKLKFKDTEQNFNNFENQADASFDKIGHSLDRLNKKFSTFSVAWMSIVNRVTTRAVDSFMNTINQIRMGGENRARNIEQADFMLKGMAKSGAITKKAVEEIKKNAMDAVDKTAYGFDESAKAAAQFAASGVKAGKEMESTLKGVAGVAAMTSSSFSEIADIFTSAAGKGKVQADEFNRLAYKGLNASAEIARQFHMTEAEVKELAKEGKISFKMFADAMSKAYGKQAKEANKTFDGALSNVKASLNRIGELWYTPHREHMRKVFVMEIDMFNRLKGVLRPIIDLFNRLDGAYSRFKRRSITKITTALTAMEKVSNRIFKFPGKSSRSFGLALRNLLKPFKQIIKAFADGFDKVFKFRDKIDEIFPFERLAKKQKGNFKYIRNMADMILGVIKAFREFSKTVKFSDQGVENLTDTFGGIAAVGHIFLTLISDIIKAINPTGKTIGNFVDLILALTGAIGRVLMSIDKFITETSLIRGVFGLIGTVIGGVVNGISWLAGVLGKVITTIKNFTGEKFDNFTDFVVSIEELGGKIKQFFSVKVLDNLATFVKNIKDLTKAGFGKFKIGGEFEKITDWFKNLFKFDFSKFSLGGPKKQFEQFISPVEKATKKMGDFIGSLDAKGKVKKASNNLINSLKNIRKQGFGNFLKNLDIKGKVTSAGSGIAGIFSSIWSSVKNADYEAIGDTVAKGFGEFLEFLGNLKNGLEAFYKNHLADKLKDLGETLFNFFKNLPERSMTNASGLFKKFGDALGSFGVSVKDSLGNFAKFLDSFGEKWNNAILLIETIIGGVIGAFLLFKQYKAFKNATGIFAPFKEAGESLKSFGQFLDGFGKSLSKGFDVRITKVESTATTIIKIAAAVALLSLSMKTLSQVDIDKVIPSLIAMASMLAGLIVMSRIFVAMFAKVDADVFAKLSASLIMISAAMGMLSVTMMYLAKNLNGDNLMWAVTGLALMLSAILILSKAIEVMFTEITAFDTAAFFGLGVALLAMSKGISTIAKTVKDLAACEDDLEQATQVVFAIMMGLSMFTALTGVGKGILVASVGMILVAKAVEIVANSVKKLAKANSKGQLDKGVEVFNIIAVLMLAFAAVGTVSQYALQSAAAVLAAAIAMGVVIEGIERLAVMLSGENADAVWMAIKVIAGIGAFFFALSAVGDKLGGVALKQGGGIALMAAAILEVVAAIYILSQVTYSIGSVLGVVVSLGIAIGALALGLWTFSKFANAKVSVEIILVATALLILAGAISVLVGIPLLALGLAVTTLAAGIFILLTVMSAFSGLGVPMLAVAGALVLVGVAVMAVGIGIKFLSEGLASVIPLLLVFAAIPDDIVAGGLATFKTILTVIGESLVNLAGGLIAVAFAFGVAALAVGAFGVSIIIVAAGVLGLAVAIVVLTGAIVFCANTVGAEVSAVAADVAGVLQGLFGWVIDGATSLWEKWKQFTGDIKKDSQEYEKTILESNQKAQEDTSKATKEGGKKVMDEYAKATAESKDSVTQAQTEAMDPSDAIAEIKDIFKSGGEEAMGPEGFMGGVATSVSGANIDMSQLEGIIPEGLSDQFNTKGFDIGSALPKGMQEGVNGQKIDLSSMLSSVGAQASNTSQISKGGKKQPKAFANEITKSKAPGKAVEKMVDGAVTESDKGKDDFKTSGANAAKGYANGIKEWAQRAADAAADMVRKAKAAAKNAQGEASPAKLFIESGMYAALGYAAGIRRHSKAGEEAAENMVSNTYSTMREAIARAQRFADDEINIDPTIRPVVDLSNVKAGADQAASMFGSGPFGLSVPSAGIRLAENISADIQNGGKTDMASSINRLARRLESVTDTMNSRSMTNYFQVDGATDPNAFADVVSDRLKLKARAV